MHALSGTPYPSWRTALRVKETNTIGGRFFFPLVVVVVLGDLVVLVWFYLTHLH